MKKQIIKCMVAGFNANGNADFHFVKVQGTEDQVLCGEYFKVVENDAENNGYEKPFVVFDENDPAGQAMIKAGLFNWESASIITILV